LRQKYPAVAGVKATLPAELVISIAKQNKKSILFAEQRTLKQRDLFKPTSSVSCGSRRAGRARFFRYRAAAIIAINEEYSGISRNVNLTSEAIYPDNTAEIAVLPRIRLRVGR